MGVIQYGKVLVHGNFQKVRRYKTKDGRPRNWHHRDYKAIVPYPLKWRTTLGSIKCDCKEVIECYQPYYGFNLYHVDECAIMQHFRKYPQMRNFGVDPELIAQSD